MYQLRTEWTCYFARVLFSQNFPYAMFRENKNLAKIYEFTVWVGVTTPFPLTPNFGQDYAS